MAWESSDLSGIFNLGPEAGKAILDKLAQAYAQVKGDPVEKTLGVAARGVGRGGAQLLDLGGSMVPGTNKPTEELYNKALGPSSETPVEQAGEFLGPPVGKLAKLAPALSTFLGMFGPKADLEGLYKLVLSQVEGKFSTKAEFEAAQKAAKWNLGQDNLWRYEVPDNKATINTANAKVQYFPRLGETIDDPANPGKYLPGAVAYKAPVGELYDHPVLYEHAPTIQDIPAQIMRGKYKGGLWKDMNTGQANFMEARAPTVSELSDDIFPHEMQHGATAEQGLPRGSSPERELADLGGTESYPGHAHDEYLNNYEEGIARIVPLRRLMMQNGQRPPPLAQMLEENLDYRKYDALRRGRDPNLPWEWKIGQMHPEMPASKAGFGSGGGRTAEDTLQWLLSQMGTKTP